jgi:Bacterial sugar transferase
MLAAGASIAVHDLEAPVIGAWLVMILGVWVRARFEEGRRARVAVIGSAGFANDLAVELQAAGIRSCDVVGWFGSEDPRLHDRRLDYLGDMSEVRSAVIERRIELLVYARDQATGLGDAEAGGDVCALIADSCLDLAVRTIEANQFYEELLGHVPLGTTDAAWFRYIMHPRFRPTSPLWKRCFDVAIVSLMSIFALPLVGLAAVAIKLADGGPVLYRQRRVGERGREFEILKLRTMVPDAEADGPQWCEAGDERARAEAPRR